MEQLTGEYAVTANGRPAGTLVVSQDGLMTSFDCTCQYESHDVLRLAAVSGGRFVPIGVMMPEGSLLRLKKRFSKNALSGLGLKTVTEYRLIRAGDVYAQGGQPSESRSPQPLSMQLKNEQAPVQAQVQQEPTRALQPDVSSSAQQYHVPNPNQSMESESSSPKKNGCPAGRRMAPH